MSQTVCDYLRIFFLNPESFESYKFNDSTHLCFTMMQMHDAANF